MSPIFGGANVFLRTHKTKGALFTWADDWLYERLLARVNDFETLRREFSERIVEPPSMATRISKMPGETKDR